MFLKQFEENIILILRVDITKFATKNLRIYLFLSVFKTKKHKFI